jgi:putative flippase GtrA
MIGSVFFRRLAGEGARYLVAGTAALALDFTLYTSLIRLGGVDYLVAAPIGFLAGLTLIYFLSVRWVFTHRRLVSARTEFAIFTAIGLAGLALNQLVVYIGVEWLRLAYEPAKLLSAGIVFAFNLISRKLLLFTKFQQDDAGR